MDGCMDGVLNKDKRNLFKFLYTYKVNTCFTFRFYYLDKHVSKGSSYDFWLI